MTIALKNPSAQQVAGHCTTLKTIGSDFHFVGMRNRPMIPVLTLPPFFLVHIWVQAWVRALGFLFGYERSGKFFTQRLGPHTIVFKASWPKRPRAPPATRLHSTCPMYRLIQRTVHNSPNRLLTHYTHCIYIYAYILYI
jgi:hypothetical protein